MPQLRSRRFSQWILSALVALAVSCPAFAQAPRRVASLNLCADQLLLALADREQISSLSPLARDRSISFLADRAAGLPMNAGRGEEILFEKADLVLGSAFGGAAGTALLRRQGLEVIPLAPWRNLAEGREQIRLVARRLGHADRGEALIADIDAALARAKDIVSGPRTILIYYRRGWVPASDSLIGEVLRRMGFTLQQEALGLEQGGVARLEGIVMAPPDYLLMDEDSGKAVDNGSALLSHPALAEAVPAPRRLTIPNRLGICGGPSTPALIDALAAEVRAKVR